MSTMADALSSASLLLGALALLYGAWSSSIDIEEKRIFSQNSATKIEQQQETKRIMKTRALPLALAATLILLAFLPRCLTIVCSLFNCKGKCVYDDVAAIFFLTQLFVLGFVVHLFGRVRALWMHART